MLAPPIMLSIEAASNGCILRSIAWGTICVITINKLEAKVNRIKNDNQNTLVFNAERNEYPKSSEVANWLYISG